MSFAIGDTTLRYSRTALPLSFKPSVNAARLIRQTVEKTSAAITEKLDSRDNGIGFTILAVDDESMIRQLMVAALKKKGYHVLEASNGTEALELIEQHKGAIDLLVTDVVMPRIGGAELARRLRETRPNAAVLMVTGCSEQMVTGTSVSTADAGILQKPFRSMDLVNRVHELLQPRN